jgi:hypothetical protein
MSSHRADYPVKIYKLKDQIDFGKYKGKVVEDIIHEDPDYFIWLMTQTRQFLLDLIDWSIVLKKYPELSFDKSGLLNYELKRMSIASPKEQASMSLVEKEWHRIKPTSLNKHGEIEHGRANGPHVLLNYNDPFHITNNVNNWKYVRLGVDADAVPELIVYCKSERTLTCFTGSFVAQFGYPIVNEPVQYYYFRINMDSAEFGQVAQALLHLGFLTLKDSDTNV